MQTESILTLLVGLFVGYLIEAVRSWVRAGGVLSGNKEITWFLEEAAAIAVKAAEQMFPGAKSGKEKLLQATEFILAFAAQRGIKITPIVRTLIRAAIEAAVLELDKPTES